MKRATSIWAVSVFVLTSSLGPVLAEGAPSAPGRRLEKIVLKNISLPELTVREGQGRLPIAYFCAAVTAEGLLLSAPCANPEYRKTAFGDKPEEWRERIEKNVSLQRLGRLEKSDEDCLVRGLVDGIWSDNSSETCSPPVGEDLDAVVSWYFRETSDDEPGNRVMSPAFGEWIRVKHGEESALLRLDDDFGSFTLGDDVLEQDYDVNPDRLDGGFKRLVPPQYVTERSILSSEGEPFTLWAFSTTDGRSTLRSFLTKEGICKKADGEKNVVICRVDEIARRFSDRRVREDVLHFLADVSGSPGPSYRASLFLDRPIDETGSAPRPPAPLPAAGP